MITYINDIANTLRKHVYLQRLYQQSAE